ncbi:hypothetical protein ACLOJK_037673, partial [Asimina triloba]
APQNIKYTLYEHRLKCTAGALVLVLHLPQQAVGVPISGERPIGRLDPPWKLATLASDDVSLLALSRSEIGRPVEQQISDPARSHLAFFRSGVSFVLPVDRRPAATRIKSRNFPFTVPPASHHRPIMAVAQSISINDHSKLGEIVDCVGEADGDGGGNKSNPIGHKSIMAAMSPKQQNRWAAIDYEQSLASA